MKILLMKLWGKLKARKLKKLKSNMMKGSLLFIVASFLIFLTYEETMQDRDNYLYALTDNKNSIFEKVSVKEVINVLNNNTGVVLFVNDKKDINGFLDLLYDKEEDTNIYVCNVKNDEIVLELNENDNPVVKQRASKDYKLLLDRLGSYNETYYLNTSEDIIETDYKRIVTPMVLFVKNGNIMFSHYVIEEENLTNEELLDIYSQGFELIK